MSKIKIVLAEDEPSLGQILKESLETRGFLVYHAPNGKVVVVEGLEDYIVIDNDNTLLICKTENEQQIKQFVSDVKRNKGEDYV